MNIQLMATAVSTTNTTEKMQLVKVRGCNRNEDCVYFNDTNHLVYKVSDRNTENNRGTFINDLIKLFKTHFSKAEANAIYSFIQNNHLKIIAESAKNVDEYAKTDAEKIALLVLRQNPHCCAKEFKSLAFDFAINNNYSRAALQTAIHLFQ